MKTPTISVVIPTYNSLRTIEKCLQSIVKQTYPLVEIIVVDSPYYGRGQRNKCKKIITKYAKYYLDGPERSIQRNRGIKEASGEYICIIDQDMYLTPKVLENCYGTIEEKKYIALTIPEISIGEGYWMRCVALERYVTTYLEEGLNECCRFFKKKDALAIGGYDTTIVGVEDSDFHHRMAKIGKIGKAKNYIYHDEGHIRFFDRIRKKYYYSRAFRQYVRRYPTIAANQFFPIKKAYFKHWRLFAKNPHLTCGIILLRGAEVFAGILGLMLKR